MGLVSSLNVCVDIGVNKKGNIVFYLYSSVFVTQIWPIIFLFPVLVGLYKNTVSLVLEHSLLSKDRNEAKREEFGRNQMSTIDGQRQPLL